MASALVVQHWQKWRNGRALRRAEANLSAAIQEANQVRAENERLTQTNRDLERRLEQSSRDLEALHREFHNTQKTCQDRIAELQDSQTRQLERLTRLHRAEMESFRTNQRMLAQLQVEDRIHERAMNTQHMNRVVELMATTQQTFATTLATTQQTLLAAANHAQQTLLAAVNHAQTGVLQAGNLGGPLPGAPQLQNTLVPPHSTTGPSNLGPVQSFTPGVSQPVLPGSGGSVTLVPYDSLELPHPPVTVVNPRITRSSVEIPVESFHLLGPHEITDDEVTRSTESTAGSISSGAAGPSSSGAADSISSEAAGPSSSGAAAEQASSSKGGSSSIQLNYCVIGESSPPMLQWAPPKPTVLSLTAKKVLPKLLLKPWFSIADFETNAISEGLSESTKLKTNPFSEMPNEKGSIKAFWKPDVGGEVFSEKAPPVRQSLTPQSKVPFKKGTGFVKSTPPPETKLFFKKGTGFDNSKPVGFLKKSPLGNQTLAKTLQLRRDKACLMGVLPTPGWSF